MKPFKYDSKINNSIFFCVSIKNRWVPQWHLAPSLLGGWQAADTDPERSANVGIILLNVTTLYLRFGLLWSVGIGPGVIDRLTSAVVWQHFVSALLLPCSFFIAQVSKTPMNLSIYRRLRQEVKRYRGGYTFKLLGCIFLSLSPRLHQLQVRGVWLYTIISPETCFMPCWQ